MSNWTEQYVEIGEKRNGSFYRQTGIKTVGSFVEIPPPEHAPLNDRASSIGVLACLSIDDSVGPFRCVCCSKMQPAGTLVWVPDSVRLGHNLASIYEAARLTAYNGEFSSWCIFCARKLNSPPTPVFEHRNWLRRVFRWI